jgi:hypothetical protein
MQKFFSNYPLQKQLKKPKIMFVEGLLVFCRRSSFTPRFLKTLKKPFGFGKAGVL